MLAPAPEPSVQYSWLSEIDRTTAHDIVDLYNSALRTENLIGYPGPLTPESAQEIVNEVAGAVRAGRQEFFAVRSGIKLVGMALLTPNPLPNCHHRAELSKGIIVTEWRGRRIVRSALAEIARHCLLRNISILTLDVREHSRAHRLWEALGFQPYGRLDDYARVNGTCFGGLFMYIAAERLLTRSRMDSQEWQPC